MQFKNLSAFYGAKQILTDITFTLAPGKLTALVGKNGCGKSTLLSCVNGQVRFTGEILLDGRSIRAYSPMERAKRVALLPQFLPAATMPAEQLIAMGRNPYLGLTGRLQQEDRERIEAAIELTGTQALRCQSVATLSGGERQKVYLAMILAQDADILLLDEPTAHMDMGYAADFLALLRQLTDEHGKTVLAVLHDLNAATAFAHELLLMESGRLTDPRRIEEVFGVRKTAYTENGEIKYFYK